jgi:hypothetical protein
MDAFLFGLPSFVIVMSYYLVIFLNIQKLPLLRALHFQTQFTKKCEKFKSVQFLSFTKKTGSAAVSPFSIKLAVTIIIVINIISSRANIELLGH